MARTDTLGNFLTDVADAIREKKGDNEPIIAANFDTEIANLPSGADLEIGVETYTTNGSNIVFPSSGKDGFSQMVINVNVPGGGHDWSEIGYSVEPRIMQDEFNYAKQIYNNWDSTITDRSNAFKDDKDLLVFPIVDCTNTTNLNSAFKNSYLEEINLTSPGGNCESTFEGCSKLKYANLNFTNTLQNVYHMFYNCTDLKSLNLGSQFNLRFCGSLMEMFKGCSSLTTLDLSKVISWVNPSSPPYTKSNIDSVAGIFEGCTNLTHIDFWNNIKFGNAYNNFSKTGYKDCFKDCPNLDDATLNEIFRFISYYTSNDTYRNLNYIGLTESQAKRCQSMINFPNFHNNRYYSYSGKTGYTDLDKLAAIGSVTNITDFGDTITNYAVGANTELDNYYSSGAAYRVIIYEDNVQCIAGDVDTSNHFISDDGTLEFYIQVDTLTSEYELVNIIKNINN